ncbi:MAG: leucine-rich repeat domain-containing protein [Clostridiales bacterium]|nr:leucine-rich repeat domain-containing protein [Clostridiales bacterium]
MKKNFKRTLAILLSLAMLFSVLPMTVFALPSDGVGSNDSTFTGTEATGTVINFGSYPQSKVTDSAVLAALDAAQKNWVSYDYFLFPEPDYNDPNYEETTQLQISDYMRYADITLNGEKYRAVTFSYYRTGLIGGYAWSNAEDSYQDDNGYYVNNVYYFKYEPLQWKVLDASEGLIMCTNMIDTQAFKCIADFGASEYEYFGYDSLEDWNLRNSTHYASDWSNSDLRAWLNDDFYNTAFSSEQQAKILSTVLENDPVDFSYYTNQDYYFAETTDNVFCLSTSEAVNTEYGFASISTQDTARQFSATDYAESQGLYDNYGSWLRTAHHSSDPCAINTSGDIRHGNNDMTDYNTYPTNLILGVVPALRLAQPAPATSGACGTNVTWSFDDETGELTISGTGAMTNYGDVYTFNSAESIPAPWYPLREEIQSVVVSENVTTIGRYAFYECSAITSVSLPNSLVSIASHAFDGCSSIPSVTFGTNLTSIGYAAFTACSRLTSVDIPENILSIGKTAFCSCSRLATINVDEDNPNYSSEDGVLYDKYKTTLIAYPIGNSRTSFTIPNTVITIDESAFMGCGSLHSFPEIPNSVDEIGAYAFHAFNAHDMIDLVIPNSVRTIGTCAFFNCSYINSVYIGANVMDIGYVAFNVNRTNTGFTVNPNNDFYSSEDGVLYNKAKTELIQYPLFSERTSFIIPSSVTHIATGAFEECDIIENVIIPGTVTSMRELAFANCDRLKSVTICDGATVIGRQAFYFCRSLEYVHVPASVVAIGDEAFGGNPAGFYICSDTPNCYVATYAAENSVNFQLCSHPAPVTQSCPVIVSSSGGGHVDCNGQNLYGTRSVTAYTGEEMTVTADESDDAEFIYWVNTETNRVVSFENEYTFDVCPGTDLRAEFFITDNENTHFVAFLSNAGNVLLSGEYTIGEAIVPPTPTPIPGYTFSRWSMDISDVTNSRDNVIVYALYNRDTVSEETTYTVTVTNTGASGSGTYRNEDLVIVSSTHENFSYWKNSDGQIVSYYPIYRFYAVCDVTLTAVYGDNTPRIQAACNIVKAVQNTSENALTVYEGWSISDAYDVNAVGFVCTANAATGADEDAFVIGGTGVKKATSTSTAANGVYSLTITNWTSGRTFYVRPYVIISGAQGQQVIYGAPQSYTAP